MTGFMAAQGVGLAAAAAAALIYRAVNDVLMALLGLILALVTNRDVLVGEPRPPEPSPG
ncbi:MAG: hypothetical protein M3082_06370 [Candidatus Dormibacteraeota bacterium]|nr:hypothetical protein [Candidatus Dormibacteraeota bacterium]